MPAEKSTKKSSSSKLPKIIQKELEFVRKHKYASIAAGLGIVIALLVAFPFRFLVVPAIVNGQPIYSWKYVTELHNTAGQQVLNTLISEILVEQEVDKVGIQITQEEIDAQVAEVEAQFGEETGGLDSMLALQGLTREKFVEQLRLNLALEKLVKGNIEVSEEEIQTELAENAESYLDLEESDAATTAAENLRSAQLQTAFQTWFQEVQTGADIKNFFSQPAVAPPLTQ